MVEDIPKSDQPKEQAKEQENTQIRLTGELVNKVFKVLTDHEPQCGTGLVACQYLSAIQAMMICQRVSQKEDRQEIVNELAEFTRYAVNDMSDSSPQSSSQASSNSSPQSSGATPGANPQDAVGVWKPGN